VDHFWHAANMSEDVGLRPRKAKAYLIAGLVLTLLAVVLLRTGRTGTLAWAGLGLGLACLLIGAAQRNSLRHSPSG
jgi:hypothetical protein